MDKQPLPQYLFVSNGRVTNRWLETPPTSQTLTDMMEKG